MIISFAEGTVKTLEITGCTPSESRRVRAFLSGLKSTIFTVNDCVDLFDFESVDGVITVTALSSSGQWILSSINMSLTGIFLT